jgi:putative addiction module component (TIGR02574 family)
MTTMTPTIDMDTIRKLSVADRLKLIDAIWETLADKDADIPVSAPAKAEMERRARELRENPESALSHDEVMDWLRGKQWRQSA